MFANVLLPSMQLFPTNHISPEDTWSDEDLGSRPRAVFDEDGRVASVAVTVAVVVSVAVRAGTVSEGRVLNRLPPSIGR